MTIRSEDRRCRNCSQWPKCRGEDDPATGKPRIGDTPACFLIFEFFIPPSEPAPSFWKSTLDPVLLSMPHWYDREQEIIKTLSGKEQRLALEALDEEHKKWYRDNPPKWSYR